MLFIDHVLLSEEIIDEQFVCNLSACKGACCVAGEGGAPLTEEECSSLERDFEKIKPYLKPEGLAEMEKNGIYISSPKSAYEAHSAPLLENGACTYLTFDELGIAKCGIQKAFQEKKIDWPKPISCHLYPIRISEAGEMDLVNYDRWEICKDACTNGKKLKVAVYEFLKEPLIRKYGEDFYDELSAAAEYHKSQNKQK